jgi:CBS domain-containing protein
MTREVEAVTGRTSVAEAAAKMMRLDIGFLVVYNDSEPVGVVTDRDIVVRSVNKAMDPSAAKVGDIMCRNIASCFEDEGLEAVAHRMRERQVRRLLVLDRSNVPVGIISLGDLAVRGNKSLAGEVFDWIAESS